jgi:hypothetical protein
MFDAVFRSTSTAKHAMVFLALPFLEPARGCPSIPDSTEAGSSYSGRDKIEERQKLAMHPSRHVSGRPMQATSLYLRPDALFCIWTLSFQNGLRYRTLQISFERPLRYWTCQLFRDLF